MHPERNLSDVGECVDADGHPLPEERQLRNRLNPFIERAESAGVVDDAFVLDSTHVQAAEVAGAIGANLAPVQVRHRARMPRPSGRRVIAFWVALIVAEAALMVWIWAQIARGVL